MKLEGLVKDEKRQLVIRCNHGRLRWGRGMRAGRNIPFIETFSKI